jgi:hypothetical protein
MWVICWVYPVGDLLGLYCGSSVGLILWVIYWVYAVGDLLGLSCHAWRAPWVRPMVGPGPRTAPNLLLRAHATMKNNWRQATCSSSEFTDINWEIFSIDSFKVNPRTIWRRFLEDKELSVLTWCAALLQEECRSSRPAPPGWSPGSGSSSPLHLSWLQPDQKHTLL